MTKLFFIVSMLLVSNSSFADPTKTWEENILSALSEMSEVVVPCGKLNSPTVGYLVSTMSSLETLKPTGPFTREVILHSESADLHFSVHKSANGPVVNGDSLVCVPTENI